MRLRIFVESLMTIHCIVYAASATGGNDFARDFLSGIAALYSTPSPSPYDRSESCADIDRPSVLEHWQDRAIPSSMGQSHTRHRRHFRDHPCLRGSSPLTSPFPLPPPPLSPLPPPELPYPASGHACLALSSLLSLFELPCDYKLTVVQYFYRHGERIRLNSKFASQIAEQRDREFEEDEKKNVPDEHIERTGDDAEFNRGGAEQGQGQG